jgi:membrane protease subunit (stomatin/prohibitin family)
LLILVLVIGGVAGWFLMNNLRQCQQQLVQAGQAQQAEQKKALAEHTAAAQCTQQLAACKTESSTCSTALEAERAHVKQLESIRAAQPAGSSRGAQPAGKRRR